MSKSPGERLKQLRNDLDLNQNDWAKIIQANENTVARWERGESSPTKAYKKRTEQIFSIADDEDAWNIVKETILNEPEGKLIVATLFGMFFGAMNYSGTGLKMVDSVFRYGSPFLAVLDVFIKSRENKKQLKF